MEANSSRTVLAWALGVPFFLMPVSLTVDAPDIYGGYGVHVVQALWMVGLGVACGLIDARGAHWREALHARPWWSGPLAGLGWLLGAALIAAVAGTIAGGIARPLARLLGALPVVPVRPWPLPRPSIWVAAAVLLPALRLAVGRDRPVSVVRVLALVGLLAQAGAWWAANQLTLESLGPTPLLVLAGVACVAWPLARGHGAAGDRVAWALIAGALVVPGLALGVLLVPRWAPPLGEAGARAVVVVGAAIAAAAACWWLRAVLARVAISEAGALEVARRARRLFGRLPLWLALVFFAMVASVVAVLGAGVLVELSGLLAPADPRPHGLPLAPGFVLLPWFTLILSLGRRAGTLGGLRTFLAGASVGGSALVLGQVAAQLGMPALWSLTALALVGFIWAFWPGRLPDRALVVFSLATPVVLGPVVARYLLSIRIGGEIPGVVTVGLGLALSLPLVRALPRGPASAPVSIRSLALTLPLLAIALLLPIYITVHAGLRPGSFFAAVAVLGAALVLSRLRGRPLPWTVAWWLLFYAGFVQTAVFKLGPGPQACRQILADTGATVLIDRHREGGEYRDAYPYDVVPLPDRSTVLASFKRIDKRGGFLEVIDPADPSRRARTVVRREGAGGPLWPERIVTDPKTGHAMVQIIGVGAHALWELIPQGDRSAVEPVVTGRTLELGYEPGNPAVDVGRRTLAMTYVPNRGQSNPLLEVFDLDSFTSRGETRQARFVQMSDFVETDVDTGRHYAPTLYDFLRFAVIEVMPDLGLGRHWETYHPVIGLAADPAAGRLYVTNPLAGVMEVLDLATFSVVQTLPVGRFPRDVAHDPARNRLYVANYGDGSVVTLSTDGGVLKEIGRAEVGWLLRGLGVDGQSGMAVAASGCGVFAIESIESIESGSTPRP